MKTTQTQHGVHGRTDHSRPTRDGRVVGIVAATLVIGAAVSSVRLSEAPVDPATIAPEARAAIEARFLGTRFTARRRAPGWPPLFRVTALQSAGRTGITVNAKPLNAVHVSDSDEPFRLLSPRWDTLQAFSLIWEALEPQALYRTVDQVQVIIRFGSLSYAATASTADLAAFGHSQITSGEFQARWVVERSEYTAGSESLRMAPKPPA